MVTVALAHLVRSALLNAVTVTLAGEGTTAGAVNMPFALILPTVESPPVTPLTCQVTDVSVALRTVARNCSLRPVSMVADEGETVTVIGGAAGGLVMFTAALPAADGTALLVA